MSWGKELLSPLNNLDKKVRLTALAELGGKESITKKDLRRPFSSNTKRRYENNKGGEQRPGKKFRGEAKIHTMPRISSAG